jgi:hypothetical protein
MKNRSYLGQKKIGKIELRNDFYTELSSGIVVGTG